MMRLPQPAYEYATTIDTCVEGIVGLPLLRAKLMAGKNRLIEAGQHYATLANLGTLYTIQPNANEDDETVAFADLTSAELGKIYRQYFVPADKPARRIYDSLLKAADENCPFCGGIGTPTTIDHFLPKAHFPQYAVFPPNLVPSCKDCNMGEKGEVFATTAEDQFIQPYVDHDYFFTTQWIFANFHPGVDERPGRVQYYVAPPDDWPAHDKAKAEKHFKDFNIAYRYGIAAGKAFRTVLNQIETMQRSGDDIGHIIRTLLEPAATSMFANHWQTGMYQALIRYITD